MYQVQLQSKGNEFTVKDVINKMKGLGQKYKMEKDKSRKSGSGTAKKNDGSILAQNSLQQAVVAALMHVRAVRQTFSLFQSKKRYNCLLYSIICH